MDRLEELQNYNETRWSKNGILIIDYYNREERRGYAIYY